MSAAGDDTPCPMEVDPPKMDPVEEFVAVFAKVSSSSRRLPRRPAHTVGPRAKASTVSRHPGAVSKTLTYPQVMPHKKTLGQYLLSKKRGGSIFEEHAKEEAKSETREKAKPRRGGVMHRYENICCPVPPSSTLPRRYSDLLMEDIRALDKNICLTSSWM